MASPACQRGLGASSRLGREAEDSLNPCPCPGVAQCEPCIQTGGGLQPPSLRKRSGTTSRMHSSTGKSEKLSLILTAIKITCPLGYVGIRSQQAPPAPMGQKKGGEGGQALLPSLPRVCTASPPCHWPQQPFLLFPAWETML